MVVSGTLYTPADYHRSWRALIAAKYSNSNIKIVNFFPGQTDKDASFLAKFPPATVPVFESQDGICLFDANAIAYFVGNNELRGGQNQHLVTQWVNYADSSVLPAVATWVYPCLGITQFNKANTDKAKTAISEVMKFLNDKLSHVTFLVGDRITQADITLFTALHPLFTHVYDAQCRKPFPHVVRWYTTIANQPNVISVAGSPILCDKQAQFDAKKYAEMHPKGDKEHKDKGSAKESKKETKPKEAPKPKAEPKEPAGDDEDEPQKPSKNPLANLPPGKFDMDAFKRVYSNEDIEKVAIPYFWSNFDPETHSIWYCEYKYPDELRLLFMTCNLIRGFFQRLDKLIKFGFGSMCIFGKDNENYIKGLWFWRGTGLAFELDADLQTDYESYSWRKLDPNADETKKLVHEYFLQQFPNEPFNQGKIFK